MFLKVSREPGTWTDITLGRWTLTVYDPVVHRWLLHACWCEYEGIWSVCLSLGLVWVAISFGKR